MEQFLYACAAVIALTNPLTEVPFFLAATTDYSTAERRNAAFMVSIGVVSILCVSAVGGAFLLDLFGVSFAAFRTAGGLIVLLAGLELFRGSASGLTSVRGGPHKTEDHLWVPLVMPLLAGPAAITAVITLALDERNADPLLGLPVKTLGAVVAASAVVFLILLAASPLSARLGKRAVRVFDRFWGMILLAIGFQMCLGGIHDFFASAPGT